VQIMGNPSKQGWTFARNCAGGAGGNLCMRSPYIPTTGPMSPASAAAAFPGFAQALPAIVQGMPASTFGGDAAKAQLLGLLSQMRPILTALRPTDAQVGTVLVDLGTSKPVAEVHDYAPLGANFSNTWEVGYKGILGDRLRVAMDVWFQRRPADPTTQLINPGVMFNPTQLGAYLGASIAQGLMAGGMPAAQAQATATAAAGALTPLMAKIPVGATGFTNGLYDKPYLVFSYQNGSGFVNVHGLDLATDLLLGRGWAVAATYSNLNRNVFADAPGASKENPLAANVPKHRGSLALRFEDEPKGYSAEIRGRYADAFPVNSGVFNSYNVGTPVRYGPVPVNALLDLGMSWRIPFNPGVRWSLNATNILDNQVPTFVGVPAIGRLIMTRVSYSF
ncbi:MAG TPA: TonB-dependent receptor, partial [Gemmatimonadaceae bacterium]